MEKKNTRVEKCENYLKNSKAKTKGLTKTHNQNKQHHTCSDQLEPLYLLQNTKLSNLLNKNKIPLDEMHLSFHPGVVHSCSAAVKCVREKKKQHGL